MQALQQLELLGLAGIGDDDRAALPAYIAEPQLTHAGTRNDACQVDRCHPVLVHREAWLGSRLRHVPGSKDYSRDQLAPVVEGV